MDNQFYLKCLKFLIGNQKFANNIKIVNELTKILVKQIELQKNSEF